MKIKEETLEAILKLAAVTMIVSTIKLVGNYKKEEAVMGVLHEQPELRQEVDTNKDGELSRYEINQYWNNLDPKYKQ